MPFWHRLVIAAAVFLFMTLLARAHRLVARPPAAAAGGRHPLSRLASDDQRRDRPLRPLLRAPRHSGGARCRRRPARVVGRARRDHRLRLAADAREFRRRPADRDQRSPFGSATASTTTARTASSRRSASRTPSSALTTRRGSSSRTRNSPPIPFVTQQFAVGRRSLRSPCRYRFHPISLLRSTGFAKRSRQSATLRCT